MRAAETAAENARKVAELIDRLSSAADRFSELIRRLGPAADEVRSGLGRVDGGPALLDGDFLGAAQDVLETDATAGIVELGKQREQAVQEANSWDRTAD